MACLSDSNRTGSAKILGVLGSDHDGESAAAALQAHLLGGATVGRPLPCDEREVAAAVPLRAGSGLTPIELEVCRLATRPDAPLDWRDKLRLAAICRCCLRDGAP
jgi:hypothetical protein